jgi:imidazolonepropionase-like amidohydrolase
MNQNQEQAIAFTHVNLVPMTSETVIKDQTVLVRGTRIVAIGVSDRLKIPAGVQVIDDCEGVVLIKWRDGHSTS